MLQMVYSIFGFAMIIMAIIIGIGLVVCSLLSVVLAIQLLWKKL